jgi:FkbM family methyltransferase
VFDAGVGRGTEWLYDAFPDSKLVLIEPLSRFDGDLEKLASRHQADVHRCALAERAGLAELHVPPAVPTGASLKRHASWIGSENNLTRSLPFEPEQVRLATLDELNSYAPPYLIKLDIEGSELDALKGAERSLLDTEFIILEMSIAPRHEEGAAFAEIIAFLDAKGFRIFDFPELSQAGLDGPLVYLDAAFVRKGDPRFL